METLQERRRDFLLNKLNENNGIKEQITLQIAELKKKVLDPETITAQELKNIYNYLSSSEMKKAVEGTEYTNTLDEIAKQIATAYNKVKQYEKEQAEQPKQEQKPEEQPKNDTPEANDNKAAPEQTNEEKPEQEAKTTENNTSDDKKFSLKYEDFLKALEGAGININNTQDSKKLIKNLEALNITLTE